MVNSIIFMVIIIVYKKKQEIYVHNLVQCLHNYVQNEQNFFFIWKIIDKINGDVDRLLFGFDTEKKIPIGFPKFENKTLFIEDVIMQKPKIKFAHFLSITCP